MMAAWGGSQDTSWQKMFWFLRLVAAERARLLNCAMQLVRLAQIWSVTYIPEQDLHNPTPRDFLPGSLPRQVPENGLNPPKGVPALL